MNGTGFYLQRNARAPAVNARRRRRRRPAARSVPQTRRPWLHRRRREPVLRTAPRPRARRRALLWQWPFFAPAQSAGAACTQCRCWRAPSAGLPKNKRRRPKHSPRRLDWFNLGTVRCTVQNPRRHLYAFIRGAPPDAPDRQQKYFFSDSLNLLTLLPPVVISFTLRLRTRRRGPLRTRAAALPS